MVRTLVLRTGIESAVITVLVVSSLLLASAQVRTSPNYQIQSDSINMGGGLGSSTNYVSESTVGEVATGDSDSTNFRLRAGYQQMQEVFISISATSGIALTGTLGGLTGGESNGSTTVTVVTDSPSGYQLAITAAAAPAMRKGADTIADYVPAVPPTPDFLFTTDSTDAHFGFSPQGGDVVSRFRNNTSVCGVGSQSTLLRCWAGLSTTTVPLAQGTGANHPLGATTTLQFKVGIGGGTVVPPGTYVATTTLTALPL
jgi:hypothetical protein